MNLKELMNRKISDSTNEYDAQLVFFVGMGDTDEEYDESIKTKDTLLDALDEISEIDNYDVYEDGEDWNIECQATLKGSDIDNAMMNFEKKLMEIHSAFDYHYVRGIDTNEVYEP